MSTKLQFNATGTKWIVDYELPEGSSFSKPIIDKKIAQMVSEFELKYSRFKPASLVNTIPINELSSNNTHLNSDLVKMLKLAEQLTQLTNGRYSINSGVTLSMNGYGNQQSGIDLGSLAKGYIVDLVADFLQRLGADQIIVNAGGDIMHYGESAVEILLENPFELSEYIGRIQLCNMAVAASSGNRRNWTKAGKQQHHLIDMTTGSPQDNFAAVHTLAASAMLADAASTAIFVTNTATAEEISKQLQVEYLLVTSSKQVVKSVGYPVKLN